MNDVKNIIFKINPYMFIKVMYLLFGDCFVIFYTLLYFLNFFGLKKVEIFCKLVSH